MGTLATAWSSVSTDCVLLARLVRCDCSRSSFPKLSSLSDCPISSLDSLTLSHSSLHTQTPLFTNLPSPGSNCCGNNICELSDTTECPAECQKTIVTEMCSNCYFQDAEMFDIQAAQDLMVTGLMLHTYYSGAGTVKIYAKSGSYTGHTSNPSSWKLIATRSINVGSWATPSVTFDPIYITGGTTHSFYIYAPDNSLLSTSGTAEFTTIVNNGDMSVLEGRFANSEFGGTGSPRIWNGEINYELLPPGATFAVSSTELFHYIAKCCRLYTLIHNLACMLFHLDTHSRPMNPPQFRQRLRLMSAKSTPTVMTELPAMAWSSALATYASQGRPVSSVPAQYSVATFVQHHLNASDYCTPIFHSRSVQLLWKQHLRVERRKPMSCRM